MSAIRILVWIAWFTLGFLLAALLLSHGEVQTCARVSNGIVCWRGMVHPELMVH